MSSNPNQKAKKLTPFWMNEIHRFDAVEVHPVQEFTDTDGLKFCEQCEPQEAHFWSVYGHLNEGGLECFEDFDTEDQANTFAEMLLSAYPHLHCLQAF